MNVETPMAFFISLVATSIKGFPEIEHYLYDIATEMELQGFWVQFVSTKDLIEFYRKYHPDYDEQNVDVFEMAHFFIKKHQGSSFFLDEVSFPYHISKYICFRSICTLSKSKSISKFSFNQLE